MAKNNFTALQNFSNYVKQPRNDTRAKEALNAFTSDTNFINMTKTLTVEIDLDKIRPRQDVYGNLSNDFHESRTYTLEQSIEENGLQEPIIVIDLEEMDEHGHCYQIVSGHRRYQAYLNLREKHRDAQPKVIASNREYSEKTKYDKILARVFGVDRGQPKKEGLVYITPKQEHLIYLETNFEARGLTFKDSLLYIDELRQKIRKDPELKKYIIEKTYEKRAKDNPNARHKVTEESNLDDVGETVFISYMLSEEMQIKGWSKPSVNRYLQICDYEDELLRKQLLKKIQEGEMSISAAYEVVQAEQPKSTTDIAKKSAEQLSKTKKNLKAVIKTLTTNKAELYTKEQLTDIKRDVMEIITELEKLMFTK